MKMINTSDKDTLNITRPGLVVKAKPGETIEIADCWCKPGRGDGGGRKPSVIENLCPQLAPADPGALDAWLKVPEKKVKAQAVPGEITIPDVQDLIKNGMPPGAARAKVARLMAEKSYQEQEAEDE